MAGFLFVLFWAVVYLTAWWSGPIIGRWLSELKKTNFLVSRIALSIVFWLLVFFALIIRNLVIFSVTGIDPGPPMGGGPVISALVFGWRLGAPRRAGILEPSPSGTSKRDYFLIKGQRVSVPNDDWYSSGLGQASFRSAARSASDSASSLSEPEQELVLGPDFEIATEPGGEEAVAEPSEDREEAYDKAGRELMERRYVPHIWAQAVAQSETAFDAQRRYIELRIKSLGRD